MIRQKNSGIVGIALVLLLVLGFVVFVVFRVITAEDEPIDIQEELTNQASELIN